MIKYLILFGLFFIVNTTHSQTINLNENYVINDLRTSQIKGDLKSNFSFTLQPIHLGENGINLDSLNSKIYYKIFNLYSKNNIKVDLLPINYNFEYSSHHPYNRNNGSLIPNRGYQHIISPGFFSKLGPLSIQLKPEFLYSENKSYQGFWDGHYPEIWAQKYNVWNHLDTPERFGDSDYKKILLGQSSIRLNFNKLSIGLSTENLWWGPSIRNSIMMSNHARGFKHLTFNTLSPINSSIGSFEWQFVTGKLERSGFTPPQTDRMFGGTLLYIEKANQAGDTRDWRYFQGISFTYNPKWIDGLSLGFIRWVQMYSGLLDGKYTWMKGDPSYFPVFANLFRKNDKYQDYEEQTNQGGGVFLRWFWDDSNAEIYCEFHQQIF